MALTAGVGQASGEETAGYNPRRFRFWGLWGFECQAADFPVHDRGSMAMILEIVARMQR